MRRYLIKLVLIVTVGLTFGYFYQLIFGQFPNKVLFIPLALLTVVAFDFWRLAQVEFQFTQTADRIFKENEKAIINYLKLEEEDRNINKKQLEFIASAYIKVRKFLFFKKEVVAWFWKFNPAEGGVAIALVYIYKKRNQSIRLSDYSSKIFNWKIEKFIPYYFRLKSTQESLFS